MMTNQVTSIEQSNRLIELGIPKEKASFVWTTVDDNKTVVERDLCLPENIEGYAFTVADLMAMLPLTITEQGHVCEFSLKRMGDLYGVEYYCHIVNFCVSFLFCNTAIEALEYSVEWFAKNKYHLNL